MNRRQRKAHVWLWPLLIAVMSVTFLAALSAKARVENATVGADAPSLR
jgi:hypothetical protein